MNPIQAILSGFRNYAKFDGRASRSEYWWFYGFFVALLLAIFVASVAWMPALFSLWGVYIAAMLPPLLAVTVRRLHDVDRPGRWAILALIPFAGVRLTRLLVQPGTPGPNRYGPDPLRPTPESGPEQRYTRPTTFPSSNHSSAAASEPAAAQRCSNCGWERWPDAMFCADCGARL